MKKRKVYTILFNKKKIKTTRSFLYLEYFKKLMPENYQGGVFMIDKYNNHREITFFDYASLEWDMPKEFYTAPHASMNGRF